MAGTGRKRTVAKPAPDAGKGLTRVRYNPPGTYALDLEVVPVSDLRRRASVQHLSTPQRIEFYLLIAVTRGVCTHWVDFEANACRAGSWIFVRPGQVQRFDAVARWDGWLVMFRPEFLLPRGGSMLRSELATAGSLDGLRSHLRLDAAEHRIGLACIEQMRADSARSGSDADRDALLRHQLHALLLRLRLAHRRQQPSVPAPARSLQRFQRFRDALDADFASVHQVRDYARRLGYSERSLTRSTRELAGVSAKAFVSQRIALEAKRLLAHTTLPVSTVAAQLGMDETTNFVKFFKREVGCAPTDFRRQQSGG